MPYVTLLQTICSEAIDLVGRVPQDLQKLLTLNGGHAVSITLTDPDWLRRLLVHTTQHNRPQPSHPHLSDSQLPPLHSHPHFTCEYQSELSLDSKIRYIDPLYPILYFPFLYSYEAAICTLNVVFEPRQTLFRSLSSLTVWGKYRTGLLPARNRSFEMLWGFGSWARGGCWVITISLDCATQSAIMLCVHL